MKNHDIKPIAVSVFPAVVDGSPTTTTVVSLSNEGGSGFSVMVGYFDDPSDARQVGGALALLNRWTFRDRTEKD